MATETAAHHHAGDAPKDVSKEPEITPRSAMEMASKLGTGAERGELTTAGQASALDWFLSTDDIPMEKTIDVNFGTPDKPDMRPWVIKAINGDQIKTARKMSEGSRSARRAARTGEVPEVDTQQANARIVIAGTVEPDLRAVAEMKMSAANEHSNAADKDYPAVLVLMHRLGHKPGLIDQIAGEILGMSGYDDNDIQEHAAAKDAGLG